jgi:hypothetical protein
MCAWCHINVICFVFKICICCSLLDLSIHNKVYKKHKRKNKKGKIVHKHSIIE